MNGEEHDEPSEPSLSMVDFARSMARQAADAPSTITIYPDGWSQPGDPDADDGEIAVGDVVRWMPLRSPSLRAAGKYGATKEPYFLGVVESVTPQDASLRGHVFVNMLRSGVGSWMECDHLRKVAGDQGINHE